MEYHLPLGLLGPKEAGEREPLRLAVVAPRVRLVGRRNPRRPTQLRLVGAQPHVAQVAGSGPRAWLDEHGAGQEQRQLVGIEGEAALTHARRRLDAEAGQWRKVGAAGTAEEAATAAAVVAPVERIEVLEAVGAVGLGAVGHPVCRLYRGARTQLGGHHAGVATVLRARVLDCID